MNSRVLFYLFIILALTGCQALLGTPAAPSTAIEVPGVQSDPAETPSSGIENTAIPFATEAIEPPVRVATSRGPCDHLLWPLLDGAKWGYQISGPDETRLMRMEAAIREAQATVTADGWTSNFNCIEGALIGMPPAVLIGNPGFGTELGGTVDRGSYLTSADQLLPLGTPHIWDLEITPSGNITLLFEDEPEIVPITGGKGVMVHSTGSLEEITVPAGTFIAQRIDQQAFFQLTVQRDANNAEDVLITVENRLWYAEGIGLIKMIFDGGLISMRNDSWLLEDTWIIDLMEVSIPG